MDKLNIAIIGFGGMGTHHADNLGNMDCYRLSGVYDISPDACKRAEDRQLRVYAGAEDIARDKSVDAVLIATPNDLHLPYTEFFAKAKKHIVSEKPAALSGKECAKMYEIAEKQGVLLTINQNRRYDKDFLTVKEILEQDLLGGCYLIESRVMGSNGIPGGWRKLEKHGGGMMLDWGVHLIDQANLFTDRKLEKLHCNMSLVQGHEVDDGFKLTLFYEGGLTVEITVDTNCFEPLPRWMMYGKNGTAVIKNWELEGSIIYPDDKTADKLHGMRAGNGFTKTMAYREQDRKCIRGLPEVHADHDALYKNFYNAVKYKKQLTVQKQQVLRVFDIMEKSFESAQNDIIIKF